MKKRRHLIITLILILIILTSLSLVGCGVPQDEYDKAIAEKDSLQNELDTAINKNDTLQGELDKVIDEKDDLQNELDTAIDENDALQSELDKVIDEKIGLQNELNTAIDMTNTLQNELDTMVNEKDALQNELDMIRAVYPPRDFSSVTELEKWALRNRMPSDINFESLFRAAFEVQQLGIQDGYLISVIYDENDKEPGSGWVFCGALANGRFYIWEPGIGEVYDWYADMYLN